MTARRSVGQAVGIGDRWRLMCSLGLLSWLLLAGCTTSPPTGDVLSARAENLPQQVELREVPFFPQDEFQCGPASLAMVLMYQGVAVTPEQLREEVYVPHRQGSFTMEMMAAARSRGLLVYELEASLPQLLHELAAGNPVLVLQNLGLSWYPYWHYAVIVGYDLQRREVLLRSGLEERYWMPLKLFKRTWARADHWALVVLSPDTLPATATESGYVKAAMQLETVGRVREAHQAYLSALERWPDSRIGLMGLGNTSYVLEEYALAEWAFRRLVALEPKRHEVWNNLAYALVAQACDQEAIAAAQCALSLAPEDENALASLMDILKSDALHADMLACEPVQCPLPLD